MADLFEQIRDLLLGFLEANQYYALALLIGIEEAGVPLPLPGDLAIMFMGSQIALGSAHPVGVVAVAAASATAGASVLYWLARRLGLEMLRRFGRYVRVDESKIESFENWFRQHGGLAIIVGRMIPGLRIA
ncbi:MAG: VTT domain-containing protein, partial [Chloroflexota bacterium]|nr:VTT domain-containing protein [Chloroflexota bacterium]